MTTKLGKIIIINGPSSSGKTSIVRALQEILEEPYLETGIDKFIWMLPHRYLDRPLWDDVLGLANQAGELGHQLVIGMHRTAEVLSTTGMNVIVDHVLAEAIWWQDCVDRFSELPVYLIGIRCPLEILEEREKARKNRTLGQARLQFDIVHGKGIYDLQVDTSILSVEECALLIKKRIISGEPPQALKALSHGN
jgi:chloramphenicol 3-O phosphotransferase